MTIFQNNDYIVSRALSILEKRTLALESILQQKDEQIRLQEHVIVEQAPNGDERTSISTVWTEKGREFIHKKLNPVISRHFDIRATL